MESNQAKPRLIYDGDCGFCVYSVNYWRKLTAEAVEYRPYQEVASQYPQVPIETFQRAVQYVAPNGEISHAAKASFLTLSHAPGHSYWLWLYRYIPGFAFFAEAIYRLIASHRNAAFAMARFLWGNERVPSTYHATSWFFVRAFALIFLAAFVSFNSQALGLIGANGITPIAEIVKLVHAQLGAASYWYFPSVFWISASNIMVQIVCKTGIVLSLLLFFNFYSRTSLIVLYALYLSLVYAGQEFMAYQWDLLLLETSIITVVLLSWESLGIGLLRWLLFRFVLAGGLVKIFSGDSSWLDLTALNFHFFTQPLPTPLAWYADHLPEFIKQFCTLMTLVIELCVVFLIFFPRRIRFFSGFAILFLQFLILLTGNYNFFNLTTMALCLSLYDDASLARFIPSWLSTALAKTSTRLVHGQRYRPLLVLFAVVTVSVSIVQFGLRFGVGVPGFAVQVSNSIAPLQLVSIYGPFATMTKQRNEIIIEGSTDGVHWYPYEFKYKPWNVAGPLKWNIPFQPRLDWQMWFAALSTPEQNHWYIRLMQRLLINSPSVTELFAYNPFAVTGPRYIRSRFYEYRFTTSDERSKTGAVWNRKYLGDYLPEVQLN